MEIKRCVPKLTNDSFSITKRVAIHYLFVCKTFVKIILQVVLVEGHFSGVLPLCSRNEPVFLSWCTPIAMPETRECVVQGATNIFTSIHSMDFKITAIDPK